MIDSSHEKKIYRNETTVDSSLISHETFVLLFGSVAICVYKEINHLSCSQILAWI